MKADASHHQADAITSGAAFIGIAVALLGGPGWEAADDWAALVAAGVILFNGAGLFRAALRDLMDRAPDPGVLATVSEAALRTSGVRAIEKLKVRRSGTGLYVDIHVQAHPAMSLHDAHILSGRVKSAIRQRVPAAIGVLIHMEPYEPDADTVLDAAIVSEATTDPRIDDHDDNDDTPSKRSHSVSAT